MCSPVANQLLSVGLFPCAPIAPSLAVDLNMLDLVGELFVNTAPNNTAWCNTLESFLRSRKYKLTTQVCLYSNTTVGLLNLSFRAACAVVSVMHCNGIQPW